MKTQTRKLTLALTAVAGIGPILYCLFVETPVSLGSLGAPDAVSAERQEGLPEVITSAPPRRRMSAGSGHHESYWAPRGSRFVYGLSSRTRVYTGQATSRNGTEIRYRLGGRLVMTVVDRSEEDLAVQLRFEDPRPEIGISQGPGDPGASRRMTKELTRPFLLRMRDDGRLLGFSWDKGMSSKTRSFVRALLSGFRFVIPEGVGERWQVEEQDQGGTVLVAYQRLAESGQIQKTKLRYLQEREPERRLLAPQAKGKATGHLDADLGWIEWASFEESYALDLEDLRVTMSSDFSGRIELLGHHILSLAELRELTMDIADVRWESVLASAGESTELTDRMLERHWREQIGDATLHDLVDEILAVLSRDPLEHQGLVEAQSKLIFKLRLDAEFKALDCVLRRDDLPAGAAGVVLAAVGAVQTEEAQSYLAAFAGDPLRPERLRVESVMSMVQIESPGDEILAVVRREARKANSETMRDTSLLMLGTLASRRPRDRALFDELLQQEQAASQAGRLPTWLAALGNSDSPKVMTAARPYLDHDNDVVRAAAVDALRTVSTETATQALVRRMSSDRSDMVRAIAAGILAQRKDDAATRAVDGVMLSDHSERVRRKVLASLSQRRDAFARRILERTAREDRSPDLRRLAQSLLAG